MTEERILELAQVLERAGAPPLTRKELAWLRHMASLQTAIFEHAAEQAKIMSLKVRNLPSKMKRFKEQ